MGQLLKMPKLSMQMERGVVLEWHADEGEEVADGQAVVEIESEKAAGEVESQSDGVLRRRFVAAGEEVPPNFPLGIVAGPDEDISDLEATAAAEGVDVSEGSDDSSGSGEPETAAPPAEEQPAEAADRAASDGAASVNLTPRARKRAREVDIDLGAVEGTGPKNAITTADIERALDGDGNHSQPVRASGDDRDPVGRPGTAGRNTASPRARALADEHGVSLAGVEGSGSDGEILASDVERELTTVPQTAETTLTTVEERELVGMRQTIASRLTASAREAPHVTEHREVDVEELLDAKAVADEVLDVDVSIVDLILVALSNALTEHPEFNAHFEDDVHRLYREQNVGIAVDIKKGLVTPVVPSLNEASLEEIVTRRRQKTEDVLSGSYSMEDLQGGTFTVTNLGVFGVDSFTPIINPPEVAILALNTVRERAVRGSDGAVEFRRFMTLSLSFDHRVVDGADAARFLSTLAENIENAFETLLERGI